jgi:hypothetical protein
MEGWDVAVSEGVTVGDTYVAEYLAATASYANWKRYPAQIVWKSQGVSTPPAPTADYANWSYQPGAIRWKARGTAGGASTYDVALTEAVTVADVHAATLLALASITETVTAGDTNAAVLSTADALTETVTAGEVVAASLVAAATASESVTVGDTLAATTDAAAAVSEGVTVGDAPDATVTGSPQTYDVAIAEALTLGDVLDYEQPAQVAGDNGGTVGAGRSRRRYEVKRLKDEWIHEDELAFIRKVLRGEVAADAPKPTLRKVARKLRQAVYRAEESARAVERIGEALPRIASLQATVDDAIAAARAEEHEQYLRNLLQTRALLERLWAEAAEMDDEEALLLLL